MSKGMGQGWGDASPHWVAAFLICLVVSIAVNAALLFEGHIILTVDFYTHYRWASQFHQALSEGVLYPRWAPAANNGLGEPAFVYYPPFYFYLVSLVQGVTGSLWSAIEVVATVTNLCSGILAFAIARRAVGFGWALIAAALVQTSPFLLFTHGYLNAFPWHASIPWILLVFYATLTPARASLDWRLSLAIALLAATHVLTAFMVLLCVPWACLSPELRNPGEGRLAPLARWSLSAGAGLLLAMPYLLPALTTWKLIHADAWNIPKIVDWRNAFAFPIVTSRLWGLRWFAIQWVLAASVLTLAALATVQAYRLRRRRAELPRGLVPLLCVAWAALLLTSEASYPLYAAFGFLRKVQYPYRFLCVAAPAATLAGLLALWGVRREHGFGWRAATALPLIGSLLLFGVVELGLHREGRRPPTGPEVLLGRFGALEYYTAARQPGWTAYVDSGGLRGACIRAGGDSRVLRDRSHEKAWLIQTRSDATLPLPVFAFPAWSITVDGQRQTPGVDPGTGLLAVRLPPGEHRARVAWSGLPEEREGLVIGLLALAWIAGTSLRRRPSPGRPLYTGP